MQQAVRAYFEAWLHKDIGVVERTFSKDAVYTECYGPEYHGLEQDPALVCRLEPEGDGASVAHPANAGAGTHRDGPMVF